MARSGDDAYWRDLESHAHLPEVQELIRQEIQKGTIRVRPNPDGSIRIMPVRQPEIRDPGPPVPRCDQPITPSGLNSDRRLS